MKLIYEDLISRLSRKRSIEKISDNEFIIKTIESTGQKFKLIVLKSDKKTFKDQLKYISEEIEKGHKRSEKMVTQFGIVFSPDYIIFLRPRRGTLAKKNVEKLKKDLTKISYVFYKKFEKVIKDPKDFSIWDNLWDRSDIIEEFYQLYSKAKEKLLKNIKGIHDDVKKEEFADNLLVQLLIIWYLQEKGFLNDDNNYLICRFKDYRSLGFNHFYSFLQELFKIMMQKPTNGSFNDGTNIGKIVVTGPAPFINGEFENLKIEISDNTFYIDGETEKLKKTEPKNISSVSILNLFESRDWTEGNIDDYVLGAIYEKLISNLERKKSGTYYTPEEVTSYISHFTIDPYLTQEINKTLNKDFNNIDEIFQQKDEDLFEELFKILKNIKILDPAVGSAHFLESSINHLVKIYLRIISKLKKIGYKISLEILVADESGELERINIFEIDNKETLQLYLKFYIILSRNVYGVDINPSALKIARARLFLSMAKHFDVNKNIFIQFPNVHFNIREGNSLIGYVDLAKKVQKEQKKIDLFLKADEIQLFQEKIAVVSDLKDFLSSISVKLGIKFEIVERIEDLNKILNKNQLEWEDFLKFLRIKDNLIKILIVSLNSSQAGPLNDLIIQITKLFNERLDKRYAKDIRLDIIDLKKIRTFHWIFEFPDVFLDKKGFDIVIGNPPFVRADTEDDVFITQREILTNLSIYETLWEKWDLFVAFIERSIKHLLRERGKFSFIVSDAICTVKYAERIRKWIQDNYKLRRIDYFEGFEVFKGIGINPIIFFTDKSNDVSKTNKRIHTDSFDNLTKNFSMIQKSEYLWKKADTKILDYEVGNTELLGNICYISYGLRPNADENIARGEFGKEDLISDVETDINIKKYVEGKNIQRYKINELRFLEWGTSRCPARIARKTFPQLYSGKKIIYGTIVEGLLDINETICNHSLVVFKRFIDLHGINNRSITGSLSKFNPDRKRNELEDISNRFTYEYLLAMMNSKFSNKYLNAIRRHKIENYFYPDDFRKLPIKILDDQSLFTKLIHILQFLHQSEADNRFIKFFDNKLLNFLIYELYFEDKLKEKDLYQELTKVVNIIIEDIDYEEWASFLFKELNKEEIKKKEVIEEENISKIEKMYEKLNTEEINKKIEILRTFEWIKKIENQ